MENSTKVRIFHLRDDGNFPNHPRWPLLLYRGAVELAPDNPGRSVEEVFRKHGWGGLWRNGIYSFHHYHSNAHEVLGVFTGTARVQFGGPNGVEVDLQAGDVAVLPAGTAHKCLDASDDFGVIGGYPAGTSYDMCYGKPEERPRATESIGRTAKPPSDPVFGNQGGLCRHWPDPPSQSP